MTTAPALTVLVPTRDEAPNILPLLMELDRYVPDGTLVQFIDDSDTDKTVNAISAAQCLSWDSLQVAFVHRPRQERSNGLAGAITFGFQMATGELIVVMDGDLQHPPSTIPRMLAQASTDVVVASRYCPGGSASGLSSPVRHAVSRMSTLVARGMFPYPTRGITDPMTGFFLLRRSAIDPRLLQAAGFKILLEVLISHPQLSRSQVPLQFGVRVNGDSKGTLTQGWHYLRQLARLRFANHQTQETR